MWHQDPGTHRKRLTIGLLLAFAGARWDLYGQEAAPVGPENRAVAASGDVAALRRQLEEVTDLVHRQQARIDRQAVELERLQQQRASDGKPWTPQGEMGPGGPDLVGAMPPSDIVEDPENGSSCPSCADRPPCDCPDSGRRPLQVRLGGQYRVMFNSANFGFHQATISDDQPSQTFFNQRFRTWIDVATNQDVGGYLQIEMGHILWGDDFDFPKTFPTTFSPLPGDRVGVEVRRGYVTYKDRSGGQFRVGIQDWHDAFGESYTLGTAMAVDDYDSMAAVLANSVWDFNVGGISYTRTLPDLDDLNVNAGAFSLFEGGVQDADDAYLLALDVDQPLSGDQSIGFSAYYLDDRGGYSYPISLPGGVPFVYDSAWDLWVGVRLATTIGRIPLRGFVIYNTGERDDLDGTTFSHDGAALKIEVGAFPLWVGKLRFQTLYSTGDGNPDAAMRDSFRTIAQSARDNFGSQGYWSYLALSSPQGPSDVDDLGVGLQNRGLGLFTVQVKYDYPIHGRLSGTTAAGWIQSDARNPVSGSKDMGTELANMLTVDYGGGLTTDLGAAVLFTGNFYKPTAAAPAPDTLWEAFARVQLEF